MSVVDRMWQDKAEIDNKRIPTRLVSCIYVVILKSVITQRI